MIDGVHRFALLLADPARQGDYCLLSFIAMMFVVPVRVVLIIRREERESAADFDAMAREMREEERRQKLERDPLWREACSEVDRLTR